MPTYQVISSERARDLLTAQPTTVLDLRDQRSYRAGHIAGALMLHDGLMQALLKQNDLDKPILLYCYRGGASQERAQQFADLGYRHVYNLEGGYTAWQKHCEAADV